MKPITVILLVVTVIMSMSLYAQHTCKHITINGKDVLKEIKWEITTSLTCMDADDGIDMIFADAIFAELVENGITVTSDESKWTISITHVEHDEVDIEENHSETDLKSGSHGFSFMNDQYRNIDEEVMPETTSLSKGADEQNIDQFEFMGDVYGPIPEELGEEIALPLVKEEIVPEGSFKFLDQYFPPMPEEEVEMPKL